MNKNITVALLGAIILGVVFITYSNHFHNAFHFDDSHTIQENVAIRHLSNIPTFFKDCTTSSTKPDHQGYRPLVTTTLTIDYALSSKFCLDSVTEFKDGKPVITMVPNGLNVFWYHVSNFTWFLIIVVLLYFLQVKLYNFAFTAKLYNQYFALLGCAWYGLNTVNAETVNYVISRSDILSTLGIMGSFAIYVKFEKLRKYFIYVIPAVLGMFAKETTIMFAPALIAYDYLVEKQKSIGDFFTAKGFQEFLWSIWRGLPALIICLMLAYLSLSMTQHFDQSGGISFKWYALSQSYILLHYVTQFFFPFGLSADTDIPMITSISDDRLFIGLAFFVTLIVLAVVASTKKQWRPAAFGIVWFLLMLLPTSLVPLTEVTNDHRPFLPNIGLVIAFICLISNLYYFTLSKKTVLQTLMFTFLAFALMGYAIGTHTRNNVWTTEESLWKDVTEKSPNNGRGWMNYGLTQMAIKDSLNNAKYAYERALALTPNYYILHVNYAILMEQMGKTELVEPHFLEAIRCGKNFKTGADEHYEPSYYYARYLYYHNRLSEAEIYCNNALKAAPGNVDTRHLLLYIYQQQARWAELKQLAQSMLQYDPSDVVAKNALTVATDPSAQQTAVQTITQRTVSTFINQSLAYYNGGKYRDCINACNEALKLDPNNQTAYNNMCSAYCMLKQFDSAVIVGNKAVELAPNDARAKANLEWAKSGLKK